MMKLKELLAQYPDGVVTSVVCTQKLSKYTDWEVGKVYPVLRDHVGQQCVGNIHSKNVDPVYARFAVNTLDACKIPVGAFYQVNPHMKDGKLPTLVTGFNPNKVEVAPPLPERSYKELESLIRVGIDIQDALATNAPDLDRALVDLWFELKGTKQ